LCRLANFLPGVCFTVDKSLACLRRRTFPLRKKISVVNFYQVESRHSRVTKKTSQGPTRAPQGTTPQETNVRLRRTNISTSFLTTSVVGEDKREKRIRRKRVRFSLRWRASAGSKISLLRELVFSRQKRPSFFPDNDIRMFVGGRREYSFLCSPRPRTKITAISVIFSLMFFESTRTRSNGAVFVCSRHASPKLGMGLVHDLSCRL